MQYLHYLILASILFAVLERLRPARRAQGPLRAEIGNDLAYLAINGHLWAVWTAALTGATAAIANRGLDAVSLLPERGWLDARPFWMQFAIYLLVSDLLQWCVHVLLHRVPFLWQFHKVHHAAPHLDWIASFRFHWMELVVYRSLLYAPLLWLGGSPEPLLAVAVFSTIWGHFNHANLDVGIGALGYVFNSPRMHLWHHDASDEGGAGKNYGIVLSLWDFVFRTAYWPRDRAPARIGYPGDEEMPRDVLRQELFPLTRRRAPRPEEAATGR